MPSEIASVVRSCPTVTDASAACAVVLAVVPAGRGDRAQQGEGLEVDPGELELGGVGRREVAVDRLAVGDDERILRVVVPSVVDLGREDVVVDHGLVERDREHLVRAEADRVLELVLVLDAGDLDHADADAAVREPEADASARQAFAAKNSSAPSERGRVAHLAAVDDARRGAARGRAVTSASCRRC